MMLPVQLIIQVVAKASFAEQIRNSVLDFLIEQGKDLFKEATNERIKSLRSDGKLRKAVQSALERAAKRWAAECPDRDLVTAVAENTTFTDLETVRAAIFQLAQHPFDKDAPQTLAARFNEVLPRSFAAERVTRGITELLDDLREEFVAVAGLQETQQIAGEIEQLRAAQQTTANTAATAENTAETAARLANIEALLTRIAGGPDLEEQTLSDYLAWVLNQHRYLDPRGTQQTIRQVQVKLDEVYVSLLAESEPLLNAVDRGFYEREVESLLARDGLSSEEQEDLRENLLAQFQQQRQGVQAAARPRDLAELVQAEARLVILGDPGCGKTTLLRYLAFQQAAALRDGSPGARLPLYLRIAEYAEHHDGRLLIDFLPEHTCGEARPGSPLPALLRHRLAEGRCLVLLDGLDEVIEPGQRGEIAAQINSLIRQYEGAGNRFVVTSRVAGYRSAPLDGGMPHYHIQDMNEEQIRGFLTQWCRAVERFQTPDLPAAQIEQKAQAEIDDLLDSIVNNSGVRRLAANPLLLRTLAQIHRTGSRLPARRVDLYRLAADTLIRDWELARGIPQHALVQEAEATPLLAELAAWLHAEKPAGIATLNEVRRKLAEVKTRQDAKGEDHPEVLIAVDAFIERIRQHTGLFVERAPRRYGFMHLTFEEYFAARFLVARPRAAAGQIRCRLHDPRWREPILLAIAFYGAEFPADVEDLVEEAIRGRDLGGPSPYEAVLHRDLLFAVRVLADQDLGPRLCGRLLDAFAALWLDQQCGAGKYVFLEKEMQNILHDLSGSPAVKRLQAHWIAGMQHPDPAVRDRAVKALQIESTDANAVQALLLALQDPLEDVRTSAALALINAAAQPEVTAALLRALQDPQEWVRASAALVLINAAAQPEVTAALLRALQDPQMPVRARAAFSLQNIAGQPEVTAALLRALEDPQVQVRVRATAALADAARQPEVTAALLRALEDPEEQVRASTVDALANAAGQPEVTAALLAALEDPQKQVRVRAVVSLRYAAGQPEVTAALLRALEDPQEQVRASAMDALRYAAGQPEVTAALLRALEDPEEQVRASAAVALVKAAEQPEVTAALLRALQDPQKQVRASAAAALRYAAGQPEVTAALLRALEDPEEQVRVRATAALENAAGQPEVTAALLRALEDPEEQVRVRAAAALENAAGQPEVTAALLRALEDPEEQVRVRAAAALRNAAGQPEVTAALLRALEDPQEEVRASAAAALANAMHNAETAGQLKTRLDWFSEVMAQPEMAKRRYGEWKDKLYEAAPCDFLFLLLRTYAPGPSR